MVPALVAALLLLQAPPAKPGSQGPLDFRCDDMNVVSKPNKVLCKGTVLVRRTDVLLCCDVFEGFADDKWGWEKFTCAGNVRAHRGDELMWSEHAEFLLGTSDLILTGKPRLQRGASLLNGERIVIDVKNDKARIEKPRGRIQQADVSDVPPLAPHTDDTPLPETCPVPGRR
jgi:lipopolysaccharide export system protein LptA